MPQGKNLEGKEKKMGIVILHGWTTDVDKWNPFLKYLPGKLLKIPGLTEKINKPWTLEDYVQWLNKKINKRTVLIGHSNGGRIAIAFAAKYPEKIEKLILIDSAGIYHQKLNLQVKRFLFKFAAKIGKKIAPSEKLKSILYKLAGEKDYKNANPIQKQTMINLISADLTPVLSKISIPTLIIWGKDDKITPLQDAKLMHQKIKGSTLKILDAKHSPQFTHPKEVAMLIHEYI